MVTFLALQPSHRRRQGRSFWISNPASGSTTQPQPQPTAGTLVFLDLPLSSRRNLRRRLGEGCLALPRSGRREGDCLGAQRHNRSSLEAFLVPNPTESLGLLSPRRRPLQPRRPSLANLLSHKRNNPLRLAACSRNLLSKPNLPFSAHRPRQVPPHHYLVGGPRAVWVLVRQEPVCLVHHEGRMGLFNNRAIPRRDMRCCCSVSRLSIQHGMPRALNVGSRFEFMR